MGTGQVVGYQRVSTLTQNVDRQLDGVVEVEKMFTDHASGKDTDRPALRECLDYLRDGDELIVHSMDRLARSLKDLLHIVEDLTGRGVRVRFVQNNLTFSSDKTDPCEVLMLQVLGACYQFERSILLERQKEGIAAAKAKGKYKGRKPALTDEQRAEVASRLAAGWSATGLARQYGVSPSTIYNCRGRAGQREATA